MLHPLDRNAFHACVHHHDAADNGTGSVPISQPAHGGPHRLLIVIEVVGSTPKSKRNCVWSTHKRAVPKSCHCVLDSIIRRNSHRSLDAPADVTLRSALVNEVEEHLTIRRPS